MNKKYTIPTFFLAAILNTACGQQENNDQLKPVTKEQYNAISKEIKTFDYNPTYQIRFTRVHCTYEIYVNDMLANFSFTTGNSAGELQVDIPQYILESGPQEVKVKVYPKAIEDGKLEQGLSSDAVFNGRVVHGEYGKTDWDSFTQVATLKVPVVVGKPFVEYKVSFEAQVPYVLAGWKAGVDLGKENKTTLTKEVLEVYTRFVNASKHKDIGKIASSIYNREKEVAQAFFFKSGEAKSYDNGWEKLKEEADNMVSIKIADKAGLRYFAGSKVVALLQQNGEDRDFPAITAETKEDYVYYAFYLFRPKPGAPLEIIR
ncbi:hypothetical protein AB6805_13760 [Chitinophaga sp. RCC_12]|uniref:hypothetical protein n=1 Tax=Chitinophaga sp. RCC_12 TaxID=3239226 RepID=UPI0035254357